MTNKGDKICDMMEKVAKIQQEDKNRAREIIMKAVIEAEKEVGGLAVAEVLYSLSIEAAQKMLGKDK